MSSGTNPLAFPYSSKYFKKDFSLIRESVAGEGLVLLLALYSRNIYCVLSFGSIFGLRLSFVREN